MLCDVKKDVYRRNYYKLQNFLADTGGIVKGIILIANFICYIMLHNYYFLDMCNTIFANPKNTVKDEVSGFELVDCTNNRSLNNNFTNINKSLSKK